MTRVSPTAALGYCSSVSWRGLTHILRRTTHCPIHFMNGEPFRRFCFSYFERGRREVDPCYTRARGLLVSSVGQKVGLEKGEVLLVERTNRCEANQRVAGPGCCHLH